MTTEARTKEAPARPRTVAILESSAKMGGIQHTTFALAAHLNRQLWNPIVICPEEGELPEMCRSAGVEVRTLPVFPMCSTSFWITNETKMPNPLAWMWNAGTILTTANRVASFLEDLKPDLVITKGLLCHFYGGLAARKAAYPCLWYVQDFISERFWGVYKTVFGWMASSVPTRIAAIGPQIVRQLPRGLRDRSRVVYNAVDTKKFGKTFGISGGSSGNLRRELGIPADALVIGNAARLTPWKGQHHLIEAFHKIEAFREISAVTPKAHLLLVGGSLFGDDDYERRLRRRVAELDLAGRITFAGHRRDMNDVFATMDIFAYCAVEKDICPLSLLEAMSAGLPIAAFDIEGVREAIIPESEGLLVPTGNSEALAQTLLRLIGNPPLRHRLAESARDRVERQFSLDQHIAGMERMFEEILAVQ